MIPEIEEKFKIINWLRGQRHIHNKKFQQLNQSQQGYLINRTYVINDLIEILKKEINEIAKEHGKSYVDDNGDMVWVRFDYSDNTIKAKDYITIDTCYLLDLINGLKETYAPKIKMPQKIMLVFMEMKFNYQVDFEFFWKLMGDCVATDYLRENYKEEEIMQAWLHPELIEVSDD